MICHVKNYDCVLFLSFLNIAEVLLSLIAQEQEFIRKPAPPSDGSLLIRAGDFLVSGTSHIYIYDTALASVPFGLFVAFSLASYTRGTELDEVMKCTC